MQEKHLGSCVSRGGGKPEVNRRQKNILRPYKNDVENAVTSFKSCDAKSKYNGKNAMTKDKVMPPPPIFFFFFLNKIFDKNTQTGLIRRTKPRGGSPNLVLRMGGGNLSCNRKKCYYLIKTILKMW